MRLRANPPSIVRTTHGMADPVKGSYLPHRASSVRVMEGPVTSQYGAVAAAVIESGAGRLPP
jgi:hypothetical protein